MLPAAVLSSGLGLPSGGGFLSALGSIGSAASAFGSIGSALGIGGKSKRGPSFEDQMTMSRKMFRQDMELKMEAAKKYGFHPLTMLGVPSSASGYGFSSFGGDRDRSDLGTRIAQAGNDLSRAVNANEGGNMLKLQERLLLSQIQGQEIDNATRASMLARSNQPGNPPVSSGLAARIAEKNVNSLGFDDSMAPLWRVGYDQRGNAFRTYNDDLGDNDTAMALSLPISIMDIFHGQNRRVAYRAGKFLGKFSRGFNSYRPQFSK